LVAFLFATVCNLAVLASDHPETQFGQFGIQHLSTLAEYQNAYVGKTVMYIPANTPSYGDKENFVNEGGKFNTPYVISKISGNDERMTFRLVNKETQEKVKMTINNKYEYYSYGKHFYCITNHYSVPLIVLEEIQNFVNSYKCSFEEKDGFSLKLTDVVFKPADNKKEDYPAPYYVYTNTVTGKTYMFEGGGYRDPDREADVLGKVFSHEKVKASYKVIDIIQRESSSYSSDYRYETVYVGQKVGSDETIETSHVNFTGKKLKPDFFREAISGNYIPILKAVEKPSDATDRYGKTTIIEDTEKGITKYSYIDNFIDMLIFGNYDGFYFELKNIGQNSIKVIWNEAAFVDYDGNTSKIMHNGTKYSEREGDQPATTIIKGAKISGRVIPTANVYYNEGITIGNERYDSGWKTKSMYPTKVIENPGQLRLMLPIQVKDVINEYTFVFDVKYVYKHPELLNLQDEE